MELLRTVLNENEAFRQAYAAAVPEKKKVRRILAEAANVDSDKTFYDVDSSAFKVALASVPTELVDLIYNQLKVSPRRLVELAEEEPDLEQISDSVSDTDSDDDDVNDLDED